jgi:hypothetical protein
VPVQCMHLTGMDSNVENAVKKVRILITELVKQISPAECMIG